MCWQCHTFYYITCTLTLYFQQKDVWRCKEIDMSVSRLASGFISHLDKECGLIHGEIQEDFQQGGSVWGT